MRLYPLQWCHSLQYLHMQQAPISELRCPGNRPAAYLCSSPTCTSVAAKCFSSNQCNICKENHRRCAGEIKASAVHARTRRLIEGSTAKSIQTGQDLINKLIQQLTRIKGTIKSKERLVEQGLTASFKEVMQARDYKNIKTNTFVDFMQKKVIYPSRQYLVPYQLIKDTQRMEQALKQLQDRALKLEAVYSTLAELDCLIQSQRLYPLEIQDETAIMTIMGRLREAHNRLHTAIDQRKTISNVFLNKQQPVEEQEIRHFRSIAEKLFQLTSEAISQLKQSKNNTKVLELIPLAQTFLREGVEPYGLQMSEAIKNQLAIFQIYSAQASYQLKDYRAAYPYFRALKGDQLNLQVVQIMIKIIGGLDSTIPLMQQQIEYRQILQRTEPRNEPNLLRLIQLFKQLRQKAEQVACMRSYNQLLRPKVRQLSLSELNKLMGREKECFGWDESRGNYFQALTAIRECLRLLTQTPHKKQRQMVLVELELRLKFISINRFLNTNDYSNFVRESRRIASEHLAIIKKAPEKKLLSISKEDHSHLLKYATDFMSIEAQFIADNQEKLKCYTKCIEQYRQLNLQVFKPYYEAAKLAFALSASTSIQAQIEANAIYPTAVVYKQLAILLCNRAFRHPTGNKIQLAECIEAIQASLALNPAQAEVYFLKGMVLQGLERYRDSNEALRLSLQLQATHETEARIAQNNEFIAKQEIIDQQRERLYFEAQALYRKCLDANPTPKCRLGYGRILRRKGQLLEAETMFKSCMGTFFQRQGYKQLGLIKEIQALRNGEEDYDKLDQALKLYQLAGKIRDNKQNVVRIYKYLHKHNQAEKIQAENDWP